MTRSLSGQYTTEGEVDTEAMSQGKIMAAFTAFPSRVTVKVVGKNKSSMLSGIKECLASTASYDLDEDEDL